MTTGLKNVKDKYDRLAPRYLNLKNELLDILKNEMEQREIPVHLVEGRIKQMDSLVAKLDRDDSDEPFERVTDICGVRVICLFLSDLSRIGEAIEQAFDIESKDDKISGKPDEEFGYLSIHYIGRLPQHFSGPRYDEIKDLRFEIQVRTIAMHAWATISHYLDYKTPSAIPSDLRRDFTALSALFYLADSNFERFFLSGQEARKEVELLSLDEGAITGEEINLDTLAVFLKRKYPGREPSDATDVSEVVEELVNGGYETIADVERDLKRSEGAFEHYEKKLEASSADGRYAPIGVVRISLSIANEDFLNSRGSASESIKNRYREFRSFLTGTQD